MSGSVPHHPPLHLRGLSVTLMEARCQPLFMIVDLPMDNRLECSYRKITKQYLRLFLSTILATFRITFFALQISTQNSETVTQNFSRDICKSLSEPNPEFYRIFVNKFLNAQALSAAMRQLPLSMTAVLAYSFVKQGSQISRPYRTNVASYSNAYGPLPLETTAELWLPSTLK